MRRSAPPAKVKVEAKLSVGRKVPTNKGARVRDLEKRLAEALQREATTQQQQAATAEILRVISSSPSDAQPVFDAIAVNALRLCDAEGVVVARYDGALLHVAAHHNVNRETVDRLERQYPRAPDRHAPLGRAVLEGAVVHVPDLQAEVEFSGSVARQLGAGSHVSIPLLRQGRAVGGIGISRRRRGPFSDSQIELLHTFADQAVIAIENVRLFTELQEKNRALTEAHAQVTETLEQQTATSEILRVMSSSPTDVQPVFNTIAENAVRLCDGQFCAVFRFEGGLLHFVAHHGLAPQGVEAYRNAYPMAPGRGSAAARSVLTGAVEHIADVHADPDYQHGAIARIVTSRSNVAVPMLRDSVSIGTIVVMRSQAGLFSDRQIALLKTFADQAVIAIENVRLFTELEARNKDLTEALERQTATAEILRVISSSPTDVRPVFDAIVRGAQRLLGAHSAAAFQLIGDLVHRVAATVGGPGPATLYPMPLGQMMAANPAAGRVWTQAELWHVTDTESDAYLTSVGRSLARSSGYRSLLWIPLVRDRDVVGVIAVTRPAPGGFTDAEIALLQTFADQAVIAIENARLFKELQVRNRELTVALAQQTATSEVLAVISGAQTDVQPVFDTIVQNARRLCDASYSSVYRLDGQLVHLVAHNHQTPEASDVIRHAWPMPLTADSFVVRAIRENTVVHTDSQEDPAASVALIARAKALAHRRVLVVPMVREGQPVGAIRVSRGEAAPFTEQHIALLQTFAAQAVIAIENVRLFTELEARNRELSEALAQQTATGEVLRVISRSAFDLEPVLETLIENATRLGNAEGGAIFRFDGELMRLAAAYNVSSELREFVERNPHGLGRGTAVGRAVLDGRTVHIPDVLGDPDYTFQGVQLGGFRTVLGVPMLRDGTPTGVFSVWRSDVLPFTDKQIELITTFADQGAIAIENVRLFREIEQKSRQVEAASQHKSEFLANMSHELRTPLNAIIGFSEVLTERMFGELNEKQDEYLKDIHASGQHLLSLINDILDLSKIEAGRMELELTEFHLPTAIDNALTLVRERAGRRGIALHQAVDQRLGQIRGDERKVKQVLLNLLSNALKFTPEGGRIDVRASVVDNMAEISVADTGVGIAPEYQEAVFEEFRQVGTAAKKVEGTGLGLALSRKFIELHGGRIWVKSQVGQGSTFTFKLPGPFA